ncbi:MAG: flagellar motor protein MotA [Gemmatimonadetes bacterium]|uniref:Flagellar motor protein MotA n=1 Tax=Candidatus Kutchimonas denitrificans TaxID=3056748 RepID=A0AAE4ZBU2_9BACT|nr:flagellar motor protein MotA [Candidatus Kutchimonas denitrificans]
MATISESSKEYQRTPLPEPAAAAPTVDMATLFGVLGAFAVIGLAMVLGGSPSSFLDAPALLIVFGGTFLVTTVSFTLGEVLRAQRVMLRAVVYHAEAPQTAAARMLYLADTARRNGPFALEDALKAMQHSRFLAQAVALVVDGFPAEEVENILGREARATRERHVRSAGILRRAGEVAPAMGLIGTLVGLVQMLGNLEDPASIGPAMAVALLTTFYGAVLANMVFHPLANKLERNSDVESMVNQIYAIGAASINRQENPRRLEMTLNAILSPVQRVNYFD